MRYAIISDIHGNRQALSVVLTDIRSSGIDSIICLGDIVGYGPCPAETIESCYRHVNHFVLGNHDAAAAGKISTENFNDNAKFLIDWTISRLDDGHKKFLSSNPLMLKGGNFRCAHGSLRSPGRFLYVLEEDEAREEFLAFPEQTSFIGHSHVPGIFVLGAGGNPHRLNPTDFNVEEGKRYIVNVGSIGQPRDDDFRASYCVYDEEKGDVLFRKVSFDINSYRKDLAKANIPESSSYFIEFYLTKISRPIRETVGFRELSAKQAVCGAEELRNLEGEVRKLRRSRSLLLISVLVFIAAIVALAILHVRTQAEKRSIAEAARLAKEELARKTKTIFDGVGKNFARLPDSAETEIIEMPPIGTAGPEKALEGWIVKLSRPDEQKVSCEIFVDKRHGNLPAFRIYSKTTDEIILKFKPLPVKKGMRFSASAQFRKVSLDAGHITLYLLFEKPDGTTEVLAQNTPDEIRDSEFWTRRTSVTLERDNPIRSDGILYYAIKGNFSGEILVRRCSLLEKK